MKTLKQIVNTYFRKIYKDYKSVVINFLKKSYFEQNAGNCRIYCVLNNLPLNTGLIVEPEILKEEIEILGLNHDTGNDTKYSGTVLCDYLMKQGKKLMLYEIDVMKQTRLFAELLKKGYFFTYVRDCHNNVLQDIKDNKSIDNIIITKGSWHAVNIGFVNGKLTEFGNWGDDSEYNNFVYGNTDIFIKSVRAGAIQSTVRFLDFIR